MFTGPLHQVFADQLGAGHDAGPAELAERLGRVLRPADHALPVPPATDRTMWDESEGALDRSAVTAVMERARADLDRPWPQPLASAAARVYTDGDRVAWEEPAFARQHRLSRATVAAAVTLEDRWIDEVADGVTLLCEQSSWCWPAHDDAYERHGAVLGVVTDPFLDLGAGEAVGQLAWIDHLLGEQLDARYPGLRTRVRYEARVRVITPFLARRDWHWLGLDGRVHNWNPWIHGNVLLAALQLLDDDTERATVTALAIEGMDRYVAALPEDGAIDEGYHYWWNGASRALEALEILRRTSGGVLDAVPHVAALRETVAFPHRSHLGGPWYLNHADGPARPDREQAWHALYRAGRAAGDPAAEAHAVSNRDNGGLASTETAGLGRLLLSLTDLDWVRAEPATAPLPREVWLPSTQVLLARGADGSSAGLTVAAKGGHNDENHNHNDVGSFVVASDGVPVVVDAGRPTYTKATFGPDRYTIWTMQSTWHNLPDVRGLAQPAQREAAARDVAAVLTDDVAELSLDLAEAYPESGLTSWRRSVRLDRTSGRVLVEDAWSLEPWDGASEPPTVLHLLLAGDVEQTEGGVRVVPVDGATPVEIRWDGYPSSLVEKALDDPMLSEVWGKRLTRLDLDVTGLAAASVSVEQAR